MENLEISFTVDIPILRPKKLQRVHLALHFLSNILSCGAFHGTEMNPKIHKVCILIKLNLALSSHFYPKMEGEPNIQINVLEKKQYCQSSLYHACLQK